MLLFEIDEQKIYSEDIDELIQEEADSLGIENMTTESQRRFKAVLYAVGKRLFPERRGKAFNTTYNSNDNYNDNLLWSLCSYYINVCDKYNKYISIEGFSYISNIDYDVVCRWKHLELNTMRRRLVEKLTAQREQSLADACADSAGAIGKIAVVNHEFRWAQPQIVREQNVQIITADSLPILSASGEQTSTAIFDNIPEQRAKTE